MATLSVPEGHKISLEVFEGPLDLLLYLIKKNEVDIYDIPIEPITNQYMEYLELMRMLDLNIAGDFIVMASTLMLIKSRMLLPEDQRDEAEEEEDDPRWELVRQLIEYRKFKDAALFLQGKEIEQENIFLAGGNRAVFDVEPGLGLDDVGIFDLIAAFNTVLRRVGQDNLVELFAATFSVADKIEAVLSAVREKGSLPFSSLFEGAASRPEIICTFLAVLELIRLRQIRVAQRKRFGEITVSRCEE